MGGRVSKRILTLAIIVMTIALFGIVYIQSYWVRQVAKEKRELFNLNVNQVMVAVTDKLQEREIRDFVDFMIDNSSEVSVSSVKGLAKLYVVQLDTLNNKEMYYSNDLIEENFGVTRMFRDIGHDSVGIKRLKSRSIITSLDRNLSIEKKTPVKKRIERIGEISEIDKALFYTSYKDIADKRPIEKRLSNVEVELQIQMELLERDIATDFEYAIFRSNELTQVHSKKFKNKSKKNILFSNALFRDNEGRTEYELVVTFPNKDSYLLSSLGVMSAMTAVFTVLILFAYAYTLYQSIYQRRASRIKTDFINNMTHEFKTPIATISLAVDALKNKKIISNEQRYKKYISIIGEENVRMHSQVEHILKISQFNKGAMRIKLEEKHLDKLVETAINHIGLIVENKGGQINWELNCKEVKVNVAEGYFINALTNILDNAVKYSPDKLNIDVETYLEGSKAVVKISDKGMGMSKAASKKVFQKFYRAQTGDIHNVKGHGLGLAFVRYVVHAHDGVVYVESEINKGSTFYIKLPVIT